MNSLKRARSQAGVDIALADGQRGRDLPILELVGLL